MTLTINGQQVVLKKDALIIKKKSDIDRSS